MRKPIAAVGSSLFFAAAPAVVAGVIPYMITRWQTRALIWLPWRILGVLAIAAALPILVQAFARFVTEGRETPAPVAPTERLVVGGTYRYVRNPMYGVVSAPAAVGPTGAVVMKTAAASSPWRLRRDTFTMMRLRFALAWVAILATASGCAGRSTPGGAPPADRNTLTPEEIGQRPFYSVYEAVASLRPNWLILRGFDDAVQVYVDENHVGGVEVLRTIRLPSVAVIRYMDGIQATARYGRDHDQGAILVTTRAAGR